MIRTSGALASKPSKPTSVVTVDLGSPVKIDPRNTQEFDELCSLAERLCHHEATAKTASELCGLLFDYEIGTLTDTLLIVHAAERVRVASKAVAMVVDLSEPELDGAALVQCARRVFLGDQPASSMVVTL